MKKLDPTSRHAARNAGQTGELMKRAAGPRQANC